MAAKPLTAKALTHVEIFNHKLKILVRDLAERYPNDPTIFRAKTRTMTVIALSPLFVIDEVGPYLFRYNTQILALETDPDNAEAFFQKNSFDAELQASVNQEKADLVQYIIPKAKELARSLDPANKRVLKDLVICLLDNYIEYSGERLL